MKRVKIILFVGGIAVLLFIGYAWMYSALTHNAFRKRVKILEKEKVFIQKIEEECDCKLLYGYEELVEDPDFFSLDNKFYMELRSYNEDDNWCRRDSTFIKQKAIMLIKDFISVSEYTHLFKDITLVFNVYKNIGTDEILIQNVCEKRLEYNIERNEIKYVE
ncbi:hypothetical protein [Myroides sp. DW712]|uniref:hypothetical protein n=1 Tax=Myroides sp. DW712 TaxID=3389800 RepID=UPI00397E8086